MVDRLTHVRLMAHGAPIARMLALGLMEGDPSLADRDSLLAAIERPSSGNEQYHGLMLAKICRLALSDADLQHLVAAVRRVPLNPGRDRRRAADEFLRAAAAKPLDVAMNVR